MSNGNKEMTGEELQRFGIGLCIGGVILILLYVIYRFIIFG